MWDVAGLHCVATLAGHSGAVRALAACADKVFSGSDDTTIKVACLPLSDAFMQLLAEVCIVLGLLHGVGVCMVSGSKPPIAGGSRSV